MSSPRCRSSGILPIGTTQVCGFANAVAGLSVTTDGTNAATVTLYDNPSAATGLVLAEVTARATDSTVDVSFVNSIFAENGVTAVVSGTGARCIVYFGA